MNSLLFPFQGNLQGIILHSVTRFLINLLEVTLSPVSLLLIFISALKHTEIFSNTLEDPQLGFVGCILHD